MAGRLAGQTFSDRLLAAKHSLAGQGLAKSVCKATTEELIGPKKKHLDYLVQCTNEPNVSIPQLANLLIERSQSTNWVVVYKALVTCHHMMCYGNERYTQFLASSNSTFQLSNFLDKGGLQGIINSKTGYDMSPFIRRYARYLNEKALSYRSVAFDFCKVKRGKEDGTLRTMNADKLLKTIPVLQNQLDALLEFDCTANDLTNGIINMCFMLLFKDLIRLFACYNDGIINLLEKYFDMNKKQCKEALEIYKKFLVRMDNVGQFLKVAENVGIDKGDIPDLTKAPSSLLDALEQHYNYLDGKKTATSSGTNASAANHVNNNHQKNVKSGVTALNSTSNAFGSVASNARFDSLNGLDETMKLRLLAEEEAAMNQFKSKLTTSPTASTNSINNPFFMNSSSSSSATVSNQSTPQQAPTVAAAGVDLFATDTAMQSKKASDDLLQLSNPFVDSFNQQSIVGGSFTPAQQQQQTLAWIVNSNNGYGNIQQPNQSSITNKSSVLPNGTFVSDNNFVSVFGNTEAPAAEDHNSTTSPSSFNPFLNNDQGSSEPLLNLDSPTTIGGASSGSFDPLGGVLQPINSNGQPTTHVGNNATASTHINNSSNNDNQQHQAANGNSGLLTGDLESSLASLAENLTISDRKQTLKGVQWNSNSKSGSSKPTNWTPQPMSATTGIGYKPMNQQMMNNMLVNSSTFNSNSTPILGQPLYGPMGGMNPTMSSPNLVPFTPMNSLNSFSSISSLPTNATNSIGAQQQQQLLFH